MGAGALVLSQLVSGLSVGFTGPLTAAAAPPGPTGHPNRFIRGAPSSRPDHLPRPPTANVPKPAFSQPRGPAPVPMKPALVALDPVKGAHFLGSDGVLELTAPPGAVTAADAQAAGGSLNLLVRQVEPGSGSSAGGSGHVSFGTWLVQVVDGSGRPAAQGLRHGLAVKLHQSEMAGAVDLAHTQVLVNAPLPAWVNLDPGPTAAQATPASGTRLRTPTGGAASPSVKPALGPASRQPAALSSATMTLAASVPMTSDSASMSFGTDAPVATFGRPDPFETDLAGGSLSSGIPLDLPAGPGGLTPPLTLSYSSASVADQHNAQAAAPWVGEGWNMGLGAISWAEHQVDKGSSVQWENSWQLSDPYGTGADLVPPDVNVTTYVNDAAPGVLLGADPFVSASDSNVWARDSNGALDQFIPNANGSWQVWNVSSMAGNVKILGMPFRTASSVWAVDANGHLRQFMPGSGGTWSEFDVTTIAGGVTVSGDPYVTTNSSGTDTVWIRDSGGDLRQFVGGSGGTWTAWDVSSMAGNVPIIGRPFTSATSTWAEDSTGHLRQFVGGSGGTWTAFDVTNMTNGVTVDGDPYVTTSSANTDTVWTRDSNGHLRQFVGGSGGTWTAWDITSMAGGVTITGRPFTSASATWAVDGSGHLRQFVGGPNGTWSVNDITAAAGNTGVLGDPFVTTVNGSDQVWIADSFGRLRQFVNSGGWFPFNVSGLANSMSPSPQTWHTAPETHARVVSFSSGIAMPDGGPVAPCWRVFLPNGIMEEFGCVANALQYYPGQGGVNQGLPYIANWLLDMITDSQGNQIHVTYQGDLVGTQTMTYARDAVLATVEYDSPGCHDAQNMCTGSNWAPLMRVSFAAGHSVAHVSGSSCPPVGNLRCDDPVDESAGGGVAAPLIQSDYVLNDAQVQVRSSGSASWNTLRDYQFSYDQAMAPAPNPITDPVTGTQESIAGKFLLKGLQEIGADGATALPPRTFDYTTVAEHYEDVNKSPLPATGNCGPSWNNGAGATGRTGCLLWSQNYAGNEYFLSTVSNGMGLSETFSWAEARNNFYGMVNGSPADPLACDNSSVQSSFPCNMPDNQTWSRVVLTQRQDATNGVTSTWNYAYQVPYPLAAQECPGCVASFYWGNQNDFDALDFYNYKFMGFAQASVQNPDNGVDVHKFLGTQGFGIYDTSQSALVCNAQYPCHNDPYWALGNAAHGHEYELDQYDTNGTTLLKQVKTQWSATCPPPNVSPTPANPNWGNWDGDLVTELDHSNPVMVCDVQQKQVDRLTYDGATQGPVPDQMTAYTYDNYGRVASQSTVNTTGVFDSSGHGNHAIWSGGVTTGAPGLVSGGGDTAMRLDGSSGEIDTGYLQSSVTAESVEAWVRTTDGGTRKAIVQDRGSGGGGQSLTLGITPASGGAGAPFFELDSNNLEIGIYSTTPIDDGQPHHLVGTWSAPSGAGVAPSQFTLYVDGTAVATPSTITNGSATAPLSGQGGAKIGRHDAWGTYLNGTVGEVAIYSGVLSAARVQAHHSAGSGYAAAVMADSPLAFYRLTDGTVGTSVGPNTIVNKPQYVQNDSVTPTSTSATGRYLIDYPAFDDIEDTSGNRYQCSYSSYDEQGFQMGQFSGLTLGEKTTADRYTGCGTAPSFTPSGQIRTTNAFDVYGNPVASSDPDANAGNSSHVGCFAAGANQSACTTYDGNFDVLPVSSGNALNQQTTTGVQDPGSGMAAGGFGLWPISSTDANRQSTSTAFDALGRQTAQILPPSGLCPASWNCADLGSPILPGSQGLDGGTWTVQSASTDIWSTSDQFRFVSQTLPGDGTVSARVVSQSVTDPWAKAGVMLRQSGDSTSAYYAAEITPGNGLVVQYRTTAGAPAAMAVQVPGEAPTYLEVARSGSSFSTYGSTDGNTWVWLPGTTVTLSVSGAMLAGLAVASHRWTAASTVSFDNVVVSSGAPSTACPSGWSCADVGVPAPAGSQGLSAGTWNMQGGGSDIWGTSDQFHFAWQSLAGDGSLSAQVVAQGGTDAWAKAGVMLRQTSDAGSAYYAVEMTPGNGIVVQYRTSAGASAATAATASDTTQAYLRVDRAGSTFSASTSGDGVTWNAVSGSSVTLSVSGAMLAGLAVTSHNASLLSSVGFRNVNVGSGAPAPPTTCPTGWSCADIGSPALAGGQSLNGCCWVVRAAGGDIWGTSDQFHYVWQTLAGDGSVSGRLAWQSNTDVWAKSGLMLRQSTDPASAYYAVEITPSNGLLVQYRASAGASAVMATSVAGVAPESVRIVRSGSTFAAATTTDGVNWSYLSGSTVTLSVGGPMLAGLAVTSHNAAVVGAGGFDTLVVNPAPSTATAATAYTVWCTGGAAQTPCVEVDKTQRLNSTTTATSRSFYDGLGHLVETRSPAPGGHDVVRYAIYDASQRLAFQSIPYFVTAYTGPPGSAAYSTPDSTQPGTTYDSTQNGTTYGKYDALGRLLVSTDALSHTSTTAYSVVCAPAGTGDPGCFEQTLTVDPNGHQGGVLADGMGRKAYVQRYTGNSTSTYALYATAKYTYDFVGDLVKIVQPDGTTMTTFGYDMAGRKTLMSDPDLGSQSYTYDQDGSLTESIDARGSAGTIFEGYDGLDRPIWRNTTNTPTGAYDTYTYDSTANGNVGTGRLTGETFATGSLSGSYAYVYDRRGQQTSSTLTVGGASYPLGSSYDDAGNMLAQTYPDGETITNTYTAQGWLSGVSTSLGSTTLASNLTYGAGGGAFGELTGASLGNSVYTYSATYDQLDRATDLKTMKTSGGTVMFDQSRTFDGAGNVSTMQTTMAGATDNQSFCYDEQDRLTWASATMATPPCGGSNTAGTLTAAQYTQTFAYDVLGRLTSGPTGTYTYGSSAHVHAATAIGTAWTSAYDAAGNMTCRAPMSSSTCAGTQTGAQLGYNNEDELASWQNAPSSPSTTAQFLYDGQGQRVEQSVTQSGTTTTTVYVGDVEELSTTGGTTTTTAYYYMGAKRLGLSVNGTISYLASDGLGSDSVTLSSTGTATAAQLFAPYGGIRYSSGTMPTTYGFTGQRADSVSGLDYYGARYYDPVAGQFTSGDTVMPAAGLDVWGLSRYAYVEGNPEARIDPNGHCYCDDPGSGDNFFPQSGGRLLDGNTGDVYSGPSYTQVYHLASWTAHPHHYAPIRPARRQTTRKPGRAPVALDPARQAVGHLVYLDRQYDPVVDFLWLHPGDDPTGAYTLAHMYVEGADMTDPNNLMVVAGMVSGYGLDRDGQLTDGTYTVNNGLMAPHMPSTAGPDKSVFLSGVDAHKAVLDAARFADANGLWDAEGKAKVFVVNGPVGVRAVTGLLTSWINVYRRASGTIHGAPGGPPR